MTERGVIFNAEMVRAVLDGSKTQTRRAVKFPFRDKNFGCELSGNELAAEVSAGDYRNCPFGAVGDRLWVRETFMNLKGTGIESTTGQFEGFAYRADTPTGSYGDMVRKDYGLKWTPSIHMPRWASRITLEITGVRVERLNSISEDDAAAEGVGSAVWFAGKGVPEEQWTSLGEHGAYRASHINSFATLWESIYGADSWQANPWVWVIEFKRVENGSHE